MLHRVVAILVLAFVCSGAWGQTRYYATVTTSVTPTSSGHAYISTTNTVGDDTNATQNNKNKNTDVTFYVKAEPNTGYTFVKWEFVSPSGTTSITNETSEETSIKVQTANSSGTSNTRNITIRAVFQVEGFAGYVIYSGGANGNYLTTQTSGTTSFDPTTCLWQGTSGGTLKMGVTMFT